MKTRENIIENIIQYFEENEDVFTECIEETAREIGGYYAMKNVTVYVKKRGFNEFYEVKYDVHMSNRGYKIATPIEQEVISKYEYYKKLEVPHFIVDIPRKEIHEFGNKKFFEKIGY